MERKNCHGVKRAGFFCDFIDQFFCICLGHSVSNVAILGDAIFRPFAFIAVRIVAAPVGFREDITRRSGVANRGKRARENKSLDVFRLLDGVNNMIVFRKASVVNLLRSLFVVTDCRAGVYYRTTSVECIIVAPSLK